MRHTLLLLGLAAMAWAVAGAAAPAADEDDPELNGRKCSEYVDRLFKLMAEKPAVDVLIDALAEFGAARRLSFVEAGEPVLRPSQRRPAARRKA